MCYHGDVPADPTTAPPLISLPPVNVSFARQNNPPSSKSNNNVASAAIAQAQWSLVCVCVFVCVCVCVCVCVFYGIVCVCVHACVCVVGHTDAWCMWVYIYMQMCAYLW